MKQSANGDRSPLTFSSQKLLQNSHLKVKQEITNSHTQARETSKDHVAQNSEPVPSSFVDANFKEFLFLSGQKSSDKSNIPLTFPTQTFHNVHSKIKAPKKAQERKMNDAKEKRVEKESNSLFQNRQNVDNFSWIDRCFVNSEQEDQINQPCKICYYEDKNNSYQCALFSCGHSYHPECIEKHIQFKMQSLQLPAKCPNDQCSSFLSQTDIKYHLSYSKYKLYEKLKEKVQIMTNPHLFFSCPTPNCSRVVKKSLIPESFYECHGCSKQFCVLCAQGWHYGPCMEEEDYQFVMFSRKNLFKKCPKCKQIIEKSSGCHHISCICGYQFCYICQKNYHNECKCRKIPFAQHQRMMQDQKNEERKKVQEEEKRRKQQEMNVRKELGFRQPRKRQKKDKL